MAAPLETARRKMKIFVARTARDIGGDNRVRGITAIGPVNDRVHRPVNRRGSHTERVGQMQKSAIVS